MTDIQKQVLNAMCGVMTAHQIRHATGLAHEQVYSALVSLESQQLTSLRCHFECTGKKLRKVAVWSAA